jgi:hypothetical protein
MHMDDNIKMYLGEIRCDDLNLIKLASAVSSMNLLILL